MRITSAILLIAALTLTAAAQSQPPTQTVIVVAGAHGADEYATQFAEWTDLWRRACSKGNAQFIPIGDDDPNTTTDRQKLQDALKANSDNSEAPIWLILLGHGTFDGRAAKFNLRGPDISAAELAQWLKSIPRPIAIVNTAAASAPFIKELSAPGRPVITATKSGFEQNFTRFGQHLANAVIDPKADLDKDGQTSLLEAFLTASHRVEEFYATEGRLATEHALLDDNGDGLGTRADWFRGIRPIQKAADNASLDGYRTHQFHLLHSQAENNMPPDLRTSRDRLELEVMKLRDTKDQFPEDEYYLKLESLLHDIAQIYAQENADTPK